MQMIRILICLMIATLCDTIQTSEYFPGHNVNEPALLDQSKRAREYERAYSASMRTRTAGFYNRLKGALGFTTPTQQRPRVSEYEKAYTSVPTASQATQLPRRTELVKAYEAEARKDYKYAKQARQQTETAKEAAYEAKDKAWYAKDKAWSRRDRAYGNPPHYAERDREYQLATKTWENRDKEYSRASDNYSKAWSESVDKRSAYRDIKNANEGRDFNALLREAELRVDSRRFYPWYRRISPSGNY